MELLINVTLLIVGALGALAAIGGDTWNRGPLPWRKRITTRGWVALACLIGALCLGVAKEFRSIKLSARAAEERARLQSDLEESVAALEATRAKLASVEPSILEGIVIATTGIRRESDFSTARLSGQRSVPLVSGRDSPEPLRLYGGDFLEFNVYCANGGRRQAGFPFEPTQRGRPRSLVVQVGATYYPLGDSGRHMLIGPVGHPMEAVILNPERLRNCTVKMLIESADRTRAEAILTPLLEAISEAKEAMKND